MRGRYGLARGLRRWLTPGYRPGFVVLACLLVATGGGAMVAAAAGAWTAAKVLSVAFLGVELVWSVPVWRRLADERRLRRHLASLRDEGVQGAALLVLWAVADGRDSTAAVSQQLDSAEDVEPMLVRLGSEPASWPGSGLSVRVCRPAAAIG